MAPASKIAEEKTMVACTISGARQFGKMVMNNKRNVPAPITREAVT